jgi:two-component system response regulator LytT
MKVLIVDDEPLARNELHYLLNENALVNQIDEADGVMTADQKVNADASRSGLFGHQTR